MNIFVSMNEKGMSLICSGIIIALKQYNVAKVKSSLCRKAYWGVEAQLHAFFTLAPDGGEWSASHPWPLYCQEESPWYPLEGTAILRTKKGTETVRVL